MVTVPLWSILFFAISAAAMNPNTPNTPNTFNESTGAMPPTQQVNENTGGMHSVQQIRPGPECFVPNTGGLPPKIQLHQRARRKSEVVANATEEIKPPSYTPEQLAQMQYMVYEQRPFTDHMGNGGLSIFRGLVKKDRE